MLVVFVSWVVFGFCPYGILLDGTVLCCNCSRQVDAACLLGSGWAPRYCVVTPSVSYLIGFIGLRIKYLSLRIAGKLQAGYGSLMWISWLYALSKPDVD